MNIYNGIHKLEMNHLLINVLPAKYTGYVHYC